MVKYTSSISDDFSRDDKEDEIMRSSTSSQYMEAWSRSSWKSLPAFKHPDPKNRQAYSLMSSGHHVESSHKNMSGQGVKTSKHVESTMIEKEMASDQTRDPAYKSIQEQCDRILYLLDPGRLRQKAKDIDPGLDKQNSGIILFRKEGMDSDGKKVDSLKGLLPECGIAVLEEKSEEEHDEEADVGACQYTSAGKEKVQESSFQPEGKLVDDFCDMRPRIASEELCEEDRVDGVRDDNDTVDEAGSFIETGEEIHTLVFEEGDGSQEVEPDRDDIEFLSEEDLFDEEKAGSFIETGEEIHTLVFEERDGSQEVEPDMDDIEFLSEEDLFDEEKVSLTENPEFWWDSQDFEKEMEIQERRHLKECFPSENNDNIHGIEHDFLLQEWYEIAEFLGKDREPFCIAEDATGEGQRETLLAEWSLIEEELEADKAFSQHAGIYGRNISNIGTSKIQDIINKARQDIQEVVKTALQEIGDVQEAHKSSLDSVQGFCPGKTCVTEGHFAGVLGRPLMEYRCEEYSWEPVNIQPGVGFVDDHPEVSRTLSGIPIFSAENENQHEFGSMDRLYQKIIAVEASDGSQCILDGDPYQAVWPGRWQWKGIWELIIDQMPDDVAQDGAQQRGVAWKRRRRKFHNYMYGTRENAHTSVAIIV